jgi:probable HAF family extracellular repeat protein
MTRRPPTLIAAAILSALTFAATAQASAHYPYTLTDLGTFGGPQASVGNGPYLNAAGVVAGTADTSVSDPFGSSESGAFNGDPYVQHTYLWRNDRLIDLGALGPDPADNSSYPNAINAQGDLAGLSDNGTIDPLTGAAETDAVLWRDGQVINLGTLGGNESQAFSLNDEDQVTGAAANSTADPFSMLATGTQVHAFLWQDGRMRDLGTLGGPDSFGWAINDARQVAGVSYTSATPNPVTGQPPIDLFVWQNGRMRNLGSLGGSIPTFGGFAGLNDRGEIAGTSDLKGDQTQHPFLWDGSRMLDLGTLGGSYGSANALNDNGAVVGISALPGDNVYHAFLWKNGTISDLTGASSSQCTNANSLNDKGEVVGGTCAGNALLWVNGHQYDLNTLVAPSAVQLTSAISINDTGDIIAEGTLNSDQLDFVLTPNHN